MAEVIKIVITGNDNSEKTTAFSYVFEKLKEQNIDVIAVNEYNDKVKSYSATDKYELYRQLFKLESDEENQKTKLAEQMECDRIVLLLNGGLLDNKAYVSDDEFLRYTSLNNTSEEFIRNSYDAVFYVTAESDNTQSKPDEEILSAWTGTPHLRVIDNSTPLEIKLERLLTEVLSFLGIPEHYEIERKFLIEYPDVNILNNIKTCRKIPITQAYFVTPNEGYFRIRKRGTGENAVYIKTVKIKVSDIKRIETEKYISEEEYNDYMAQKKYITGVISKDRYCIIWNSTYYELDIYPFWNDKATIEIELLSENQPYTLPPFIKMIREVTFEKEYRNLALAQKYGRQ